MLGLELVTENFGEACPASAPFFGYMGAAAALIFASENARISRCFHTCCLPCHANIEMSP